MLVKGCLQMCSESSLGCCSFFLWLGYNLSLFVRCVCVCAACNFFGVEQHCYFCFWKGKHWTKMGFGFFVLWCKCFVFFFWNLGGRCSCDDGELYQDLGLGSFFIIIYFFFLIFPMFYTEQKKIINTLLPSPCGFFPSSKKKYYFLPWHALNEAGVCGRERGVFPKLMCLASVPWYFFVLCVLFFQMGEGDPPARLHRATGALFGKKRCMAQ